MFYILTCSSTQNNKFWSFADMKLSGEADWRIVAFSRLQDCSGPIRDFAVKYSVKHYDSSQSGLDEVLVCLWELNPNCDVSEVEKRMREVFMMTGCRCLFVPDVLMAGTIMRYSPPPRKVRGKGVSPFCLWSFDLTESGPLQNDC